MPAPSSPYPVHYLFARSSYRWSLSVMSRFRTTSSGPRFILLGLIAVRAAGRLAAGGGAAETAGQAGGGRGGRGRGVGGGAQPVVVARAQQKDVPVDIAAVGNVEAYTTIAVRSQVTGTLEDVSVHEGDFV